MSNFAYLKTESPTVGVESESVAPVRGGLIGKGMIYSPQHGDTAFAVPLFDEFMKRTMADLPRKKLRPKNSDGGNRTETKRETNT